MSPNLRFGGLRDLAAVLICLVVLAVVFVGGAVVLDWLDHLEQRLGWFWFRVAFWGSIAAVAYFLVRRSRKT
jgi:membrane protein DedA with SNARE-associated domain